ncbi:hypothetical protein LINPERPRIM_LOCUS248, partial [Linum perenne]
DASDSDLNLSTKETTPVDSPKEEPQTLSRRTIIHRRRGIRHRIAVLLQQFDRGAITSSGFSMGAFSPRKREICRVGEKWDQLKRLECKLTFLADVLTDEFKMAGCGRQ